MAIAPNEVVESAWFTLIGRAASVVALPVLGWLAVLVINLNADVRVIKATIELQMSDRYRGVDAGRDFKLRDIEIDGLKSRVTNLEVITRGPR